MSNDNTWRFSVKFGLFNTVAHTQTQIPISTQTQIQTHKTRIPIHANTKKRRKTLYNSPTVLKLLLYCSSGTVVCFCKL